MGKASRGRQKQKKAAKSRLLDSDVEIKVDSNSPRELINKALEVYRAGDAQEAKKLAKRALKKCDDAALLEDCGAVLSEVGEETMAVEALRRAVTLDPESSFPKYITLGQLTAGEESLKYLTKGIELLKKESPDDKRGLSKKKEAQAQQQCKLAVEAAVEADKTNPEAYHVATSFLISSTKFDLAKAELNKSLAMWLDDHDTEEDLTESTEDEIVAEMEKERMDPEIRMNALRLAVELEMWDESVRIARQLSEENYENCEPRYFLAFALLRLYQTSTLPADKANIKIDCYEAAVDTQKLAEKSWTVGRDQTAKAILEQIGELLEDLGPVEAMAQGDNNDEEWESCDEEMES